MKEYKHLGAQFTNKKSQRKECKVRRDAAKVVTMALAKRVLCSHHIPRPTRTAVAQACVHSRLLRFVGTRPRPSKGLRLALYTEYMSPLRKIMACGARALEGEHVSDAQVRKELKVVHPEAACCADRLRIFGRIAAHAPVALRALLRGEGGLEWRREVVKDLAIMATLLAHKVAELGDPKVQPQRWEQFACEFPQAWKQLVRAFLKQALSEQAFVASCARAQVDVSTAGADVEPEWMCGLCGSCFATATSLAVHQNKKHGVCDPLRERVASTVCPFCQTQYWSRQRARAHLRYGTASCRARVCELPVLEPSVIAAQDEEDRVLARNARRQGDDPWHGPPCLGMGIV